MIFTLKIFDVVQVMTGGQFSTQVIATEFYRQSFTAQNSGYGSAIAIVLLICGGAGDGLQPAPVQPAGGVLMAAKTQERQAR